MKRFTETLLAAVALFTLGWLLVDGLLYRLRHLQVMHALIWVFVVCLICCAIQIPRSGVRPGMPSIGLILGMVFSLYLNYHGLLRG